MQNPLATLDGRRIVLGITGGIAAYKAADLVRRLKEAGADVQVVMTAAAQRFVGAQTFQALSGRPVRDSLWDAAAEAAMGHIELARWPDLVLIAPASADTIARLAQGRADDLLTTLCLATDRPLAIAPAMNRLMWAHPATQQNLQVLQARGVQVLGPGSGSQACGETGDGRMWEPLQIRDAVAALLGAGGALSGIKAVVTAGPTREPIDPVRFITNRSSGKMGYALAAALRARGAEVVLISGPTSLATPAGVARVDVETAAQMLDATRSAAVDAQMLVGTAAVADYRVDAVAEHKIKKRDDGAQLSLVKNPDILAELRAAQPDLFIVGFAAETEKLAEHARDKLARKKLDLIAANWVGDGKAFDRDDNALQVFWPGGERALAQAAKTDLARELAALIAERYQARTANAP
ncbi:bifunctional phosphopantothenoylcysteine decarboxylase/phosphopantothenate--cysteine ligase CoaBC [Sinimarinibacterium flocculans]|uniref:Coenzyme A biosynthesis bifunctional protein CoaBC n=1 Tax=Sinimarinibacterium flocculans TaxID=985250 RepID=A0A318EDU4_9GAMM|nr:bifunctional phosphopantothenoylcysteine decarboxylase/phosphopantothenate--cysteine ligase CoaBC [Sinimarinibacterium flocculans]PXV70673.1 phosphopantothenoylcysteine decarboxylase/phosphopantothenate--cysteine ligase [Sinimarinibacterium flocculans]